MFQPSGQNIWVSNLMGKRKRQHADIGIRRARYFVICKNTLLTQGPQSNISAPSILAIRTCEAFNPNMPQKRDKRHMAMK